MAQSGSHTNKTLSELTSEDFQKFCQLLESRGQLKKGTYSKPSEVVDVLTSSLGVSEALSLVEDSLSRFKEKTPKEQVKLQHIRSRFITLASSSLLDHLLEALVKDGVLRPAERKEMLEVPMEHRAQSLIDLVLNKGPNASSMMLFHLQLRETTLVEDLDDDQMKLLQLGPRMTSSVSPPFLYYILAKLEREHLLRPWERKYILKITDIRERSQSLINLIVCKGPRACRWMLFYLRMEYPTDFEVGERQKEKEQVELQRIRSRFITLASSSLLRQLLEALVKDGVLRPEEREEMLEVPSKHRAQSLIDLVLNKGPNASSMMLFHLQLREPTLVEDLEGKKEQVELQHIRSRFITLASSSLLDHLLEALVKDGVLRPEERKEMLEVPMEHRAQSLIDLVLNKGPNASRMMLFHLQLRETTLVEDLDDDQMKLLQMGPRMMSSLSHSFLYYILAKLERVHVLRPWESQYILKITDMRERSQSLINLIICKGPRACRQMLFYLRIAFEATEGDTSGTSGTSETSVKKEMKMEPAWFDRRRRNKFEIFDAEWLTASATSSCAEAEWTKLEPEVTHPDETLYSFQCGPGKFECSVSGLRWACSDTMSFKYRFGHWWEHKHKLEAMQYMAGGPLLDITVNDGQFDDVYLPHWICINDDKTAVEQFAVLCVDADGYIVEKVSEVTSSHVRLPHPVFSVKGVIAWISRLMGYPLPLKCKVLIYQTTKTFLTLHVYLILSDPALEEALDNKAQRLHYVKIEKPYPEGPLELDDQFRLKADDGDAQISPDDFKLTDESRDPNFFEVYIQQPAHIFSLRLENAAGQVWRCTIRQSDYTNPRPIWPGTRTYDEELNRVRTRFAERVSDEVINQLVDDLLGLDLNDGEKDAIIQGNPIRTDKARALIDTVRMKGDEASRRMISHLQQRDNTLHTHLGLPRV
ncbi:uncharacterized protein LOC129189636 isoform X2 [Dunckerocampus dactyliophorus]|uniref:uncharacterized protein LOC129189636 isoform X2 n=1 Tax=Dunckerocampus dactyliophorus TaxID=161453 RepID=UPI00240574D7|nr:uncharacterized protein LOC129189636 isoform X2 [Dunckerocampus dactyliophorus]